MNQQIHRRTVLAGLGAATGLSFVSRANAQAARADTLRFGLSSYPPNLGPWINGGTSAATVKLLIYRGLTSFDAKGDLRPELAESWSPEGGKAWIFKLRDALFSNGEKVTSADVKWTIEQVAAERSAAHFRTEMQLVEKIETPDERTVRIQMKAPVATLPLWFASYHLPIIWRRSTADAPVGAGPYVLKGIERGVSVDVDASDKYYRPGLPKIKHVRLVAYQDENLRVAALQAGDVDLIDYVPWQAMESIEKSQTLKLDATDGPFMYLVFNGSKPPFNDARVRRAVAHALRREDVVRAAFIGRGSPLEHLPIPEGSEFFNPEFRNAWHYDPALAKRLLAEAGHPDGFGCSLLSTAQYGMHKDTAEIVQQHLAAVGIRAELNLPDWATRISTGNRGQYDIAVMGTVADNSNPDGISSLIDGSLAPAYVRSFGLKTPRLTELLAAGRAEFDVAKQKAIYREMEKVAIEEAPMVGVAWRSQGYAMTRRLNGFRNLPGPLSFYSGLTVEDASLS